MACRLVGAKPLSEPMPEYYYLDPYEQSSVKFYSKLLECHSRKYVWKGRLRNGGRFVSASMCWEVLASHACDDDGSISGLAFMR